MTSQALYIHYARPGLVWRTGSVEAREDARRRGAPPRECYPSLLPESGLYPSPLIRVWRGPPPRHAPPPRRAEGTSVRLALRGPDTAAGPGKGYTVELMREPALRGALKYYVEGLTDTEVRPWACA